MKDTTENNNTEIIKNNRLIAEFMGYETNDLLKNGSLYICKDNISYGELNKKFNDWNGLMPVVEKIQKMYPVQSEHNEGKQLVYSINHWLTNSHKELTKLEATYKACVQFIEWYNEQKEK
ncbi:MAG: hypothetical protein KDD03_13180 [Gelidibacter sp.]|nr:hypothetical protein [Gelidibacter sp.]